jgi:hypothetical protein
MAGLIDLSRAANSFPLQAYAVSRARFFIGTASGPLALACGFKVPTAITNALHFSMWNDGNVVLGRRNIRLGSGTYDSREFIDAFQGIPGVPDEVTWDDNTPDELCGVAEHLFAATAACAGWRRPLADETADPVAAAGITLPLPRRQIGEGFELTWL